MPKIEQVSKTLQVFQFAFDSDLKPEERVRINWIPLNKEDFDKYSNSLSEYKGTKLVSHYEEASKRLYGACLAPDADGVFIYNASFIGKPEENIKSKELAIKWLLGLPAGIAGEVDSVFRASSTLSEAEVKN